MGGWKDRERRERERKGGGEERGWKRDKREGEEEGKD